MSTLVERDTQITAVRDDQDRQQRELLARVHQLSGSLAATERRLRSIRSSASWKLTSPLREIRRGAVRIMALFGRLPAAYWSSPNARSRPTQMLHTFQSLALPELNGLRWLHNKQEKRCATL